MATFLSIALVIGACTQTPTSTPGEQGTMDNSPDSTTAGPEPTPDQGPDCAVPTGQPFIEGEPVELVPIGESAGIKVSAAVYPRPDYEGNPWSQWGQGIVVADGRFFSALGDHKAEDGNSYVYEYDPASRRLRMVGDILSYVDHVPGTWGYGKIHSQMVPGPCGEIYFSTYWGSFRDIEFEGNYRGDLLFRLDPDGGTLQPLDVPVDLHGQASLGANPSRGLVYGEAVDPVLRGQDIETGPFFVYDVVAEETVYTGPDQPHVGYRSIMVDSSGKAYYSMGNGDLSVYDPATGKEVLHDSEIPGEWLRAVTVPGPDGSVYGVTEDEGDVFAMRPDGSINPMGTLEGYTASLALSPDGSRFYYMPGAHGNSADWGSPLMAFDTSTGESTVILELQDMVREELGLMVGGTYNVVTAPDGQTIYMGVNASEDDSGFGEVILLVIELP